MDPESPLRAAVRTWVLRLLCWAYQAYYDLKDTLHDVIYPRGKYHVETVLWINNRDHHETGEPDVLDAAEDWNDRGRLPLTEEMHDYRIEIRYLLNRESYRFVVDAKDASQAAFPPFPPDQAHPEPFSKKLISATVTYADGEVYDVTKRLKKYAGPKGDFYGRAMPPAWILPMMHQSALRGAVLRFLDTHMKVHAYPMDQEDARIHWSD